MIQSIAERTTELEQLCRRYHVLRLEVFGSATDSQRFRLTATLTSLWSFSLLLPVGMQTPILACLKICKKCLADPLTWLAPQLSRIRTSGNP